MTNQKSIQLSRTRTIVAGLMILLLLAVAPLATALEGVSVSSYGQGEKFGPLPGDLSDRSGGSFGESGGWSLDCAPSPLPVFGDPSPAGDYDREKDDPVVLPGDLICDPAANGQ